MKTSVEFKIMLANMDHVLSHTVEFNSSFRIIQNVNVQTTLLLKAVREIGRASCRERVL